MTTSALIRWGGLSALLCGLVGVAGEVVFFLVLGDQPFSVAAPTAQWLVILIFMMISTTLGLFGLVALYARQAPNAGKLGFASFVMAAIGTIMHFGHQWSSAFVVPVLAGGAPDFLEAILADTTTVLTAGVLLTWFLLALGWLLFGIASLRARVVPPGSAWVVMLGAILSLLLSLSDVSLDGLVLYIGLAWMGFWLWSDQRQAG